MINRQFWGMLWSHLTGILINKYALACFNSVSTKNGSFSSNPFPRSRETPPIPKPWATGASGRDSGAKLSAGPSLGQPLQPVFVFRVAGDIWWHPAPPRWVVHWWFYFRVQCRAEYFVTTGPRWSLGKWCEQFQRMQTWCWVQDLICNFFHFLGTLYGCIMLYLVKKPLEIGGFSAAPPRWRVAQRQRRLKGSPRHRRNRTRRGSVPRHDFQRGADCGFPRAGVGWGWLGEDFSEVLQNWAIFQFSPLNSVFGSVGTVLSKGDIRDFPRTHIMNCDDLYLVMFDPGGQGMTWWAIMCIVFGFIFAKWRSGGVWSTSIERRAKHSKPTRRLTYQPQRKRSPPENLLTRFLSIIWVV